MKRLLLPDLSGGVNLSEPPMKIADNQSPDLLNVWFDGRVLSARSGQEVVLTPEQFIGAACVYAGYTVYESGGKLYRFRRGEAPEVLTEASSGVFFTAGGDLYHLSDTDYFRIDGTFNVYAVTPYVPTLYINASSDLTGADFSESLNLLTGAFKVFLLGGRRNCLQAALREFRRGYADRHRERCERDGLHVRFNGWHRHIFNRARGGHR